MGFFKKKKKGQVLSALELGALKQLTKIKKQHFSEELIGNLNRIFRIYLREKYSIKESLTHEEVMGKINKKRIFPQLKIKIISFAYEIQEIKYKEGKMNKKILNNLINEFKKIIKYQEKPTNKK
jgi:hypothetical protein